MPEWLEILLECSRNVRENTLRLLQKPRHQITYGIGAGGDTTYQIDHIAENTIINTIKQYNLTFTLISEEAGIKKIGKNPQHYVTIDPIDGTTNALRGMPFVATSIAVSEKPQLQSVTHALVMDLHHNITYTAQKGEGAQKNNKKITPSKTIKLENLILGVESTPKTPQQINSLIAVLQNTKHPRHFGADALEICYVADGTTDGFVDLRDKLRVTDMAAAQLILTEAGGIITAPNGKKINVPLAPKERVSFIAIANKTLHRKIKFLITKGATQHTC
jgi:myo-inositol-1(or 4)-monophosphatase